LLTQPKIVVCFGYPCSGKSSIARELLKQIPMHLVDSDGARNFALGGHLANWEVSEESRRHNQEEMALCYDIIHRTAEAHAKFGRNLMITAPYTRPTSWKFLQGAIAPYPSTVLRAIWCCPGEENPELMKRVLAQRVAEGYTGGSQTYEQFLFSKSQFQFPPVPHVKVATFTQSPEEGARQALEYILAP
jgi:hypothetical protein